MKSRILFLGVILIVGLGIALLASRYGSDSPPAPHSGKPMVTTSFYPLYFFTKEIAHEKMTINNLTPAGVEPHDYEPTAQDIARLTESKLVLVNGGLEPWLNKVRPDLATKNIPVVVLGEGLQSQDFTDEDGEDIKDPHVWLSPRLALLMVERITAAVAAADPTNATYYETNAEKLKNQLATLDQEFKTGLASCRQREFVTAHTAFGYLAKEYNLTQVGITGLSPEAEPSAKELAEVVEFAKTNKIAYIFFESLVSPKLAQTLAREVGAKTLVLNPIEGLHKEEIASGKNYFTEMKSNLNNLRIALQCQ